MDKIIHDKLVKIRFQGQRREIFRNSMDFPVQSNEQVIVDVEKGEDIGITLPYSVDKAAASEDQEKSVIVRKATPEDVLRDHDNRVRQQGAFQYCEQQIKNLNLPMKLVDVEYRLDRKKVIFFFTADDRIDFRELVKILAAEFKTRIEMRQISTREETRRTGSIGACGKPVCCYQFIDDFDPVNTQLVKEQNLPMNPTKISGVCGKLKCCFRFEHPLYEEFLKNYPPYGSKVNFKDKIGSIEKIDIYQKSVTLKFENDEFEEFPLTEFDGHYKVIN
jgi:cell fate regulator YaaT (PSP1 superfamily)